MRTIPFLALLIGSFLMGSGEALAGMHNGVLHHCRPTPPAVDSSDYPGANNIVQSSNLILPAGKSILALGQHVWLTGRVYDNNCVPLKGAKVEIWQADAKGSTVLANPQSFGNPYSLFAGSGIAITNNEGEYSFSTVFPGTYERLKKLRAPHVNLRVSHSGMSKPLVVEMFFTRDLRNERDPHYQRLGPEARELVSADVEPMDFEDINAGLHAYFDIMAPGRDVYRSY